MNRVAVFVDAGYLFAQGSSAIAGSKKSRSELSLDPLKILGLLKNLAIEKAPGCSLLRISLYDGVTFSGKPTNDQSLLAECDDVKLRLGVINSHGQQKGVDSLIVTDLIELARQKSISDALLLSGDEDIRVGVQIAQTYGVRVHLFGIHPSRGSQSRLLMQESDTTTEWLPETVSGFLRILTDQDARVGRPERVAAETPKRAPKRAGSDEAPNAPLIEEPLAETAKTMASDLTQADLMGLEAFWKTERGVPQDIDKRLLRLSRERLERLLDSGELKILRSNFREAASKRLAAEVNQMAGKSEPNE